MSARRSSGVHLARGGSGWDLPPTMADSLPFAFFSRLMPCQSPPFSVARQKHCGVRCGWMSMLLMILLSRGRQGPGGPFADAAADHPVGILALEPGQVLGDDQDGLV